MNAASDVAYALNLDLDAISRRLHDPDGPHLQDVETILYALHSLRAYIDPPAMRAYETSVMDAHDGEQKGHSAENAHDGEQAIHDDHLQARTPG